MILPFILRGLCYKQILININFRNECWCEGLYL